MTSFVGDLFVWEKMASLVPANLMHILGSTGAKEAAASVAS